MAFYDASTPMVFRVQLKRNINAKCKDVQLHKANMKNEEWNKTQSDAPFVVFYDMRAAIFVLPDDMSDVSIVGLQWFIFPIKPHKVSQAK